MSETAKNVVKLSKVYTFEGKEIKAVDLSKMDDLTSEDLFEATKMFSTAEYITPRPESDPKFCCIVAAKASGIPKEFFNGLSFRDTVKVRNAVQTFFQDTD